MKFIFILLLTLVSCKNSEPQQSSELKLLSKSEIISKAKSGSFNYMYASFLNEDGDPISQTDRALLNKGQLGKDYYIDGKGIIKEVRTRPITHEDKFVEIQRIEIASNPLGRISQIDIDCTQLFSLYDRVHSSDQEVRTNGGDMQSVDAENLQITISALAKCGWTEEFLETIWLVFQHSDSDIMAYFYSDLKSFSEQGKLRKSSIALMADRLLMYHGYKQLYGSQITNVGLYNLEDPDNVNQRRATMDLGPIEEYIDRWGLDFEEEKERMADVP